MSTIQYLKLVNSGFISSMKWNSALRNYLIIMMNSKMRRLKWQLSHAPSTILKSSMDSKSVAKQSRTKTGKNWIESITR